VYMRATREIDDLSPLRGGGPGRAATVFPSLGAELAGTPPPARPFPGLAGAAAASACRALYAQHVKLPEGKPSSLAAWTGPISRLRSIAACFSSSV
jgi:hypothetical protein